MANKMTFKYILTLNPNKMKNLLFLTVFITLSLHNNAQTVTDIDGNVYNTVTIGTQTWMAENLQTISYNNGERIPIVLDNTDWYNLTSGAFTGCHIPCDTYGRLYNYYAVEDSRKICPTNWHVPSDTEWETLIDSMGGSDIAGGKLKETGTTHWANPNVGATNESGYTALPGLFRFADGTYYGIDGTGGYWWSSTQKDASSAWYSWVVNSNTSCNIGSKDKNYGYSIRCVKDPVQIPMVITANISEINETTSTSGGNVTNDGGESVTERGVVWSTYDTVSVDYSEGITFDGSGTGSYVSYLTGLIADTTYYVKAYATNSVGTAYGNLVNFKTLDQPSSILALESKDALFYPVPAFEKLYIKNTIEYSSIIILDLNGKQLLNKHYDKNPIDISNLENGMYIIKLKNSEKIFISKFIKQ
jgi:uncharacterized protein (TIGR02145 family)